MMAYSLQFGMDRVSSLKRADISAAPAIPVILRNTMRGLDMKQIKLTQGKVTLVDDSDFEWLNQWKWYARRHRNTYYATRHFSPRRMHRLILNAQTAQEIDHKDRDGLNNQRKNLRFCTHGQNKMNSTKRTNGSSIYKGVCWHKRDKRWRAKITLNGKQKQLGSFISEMKAAKAYDKAALELFGAFAKLNFSKKGGV